MLLNIEITPDDILNIRNDIICCDTKLKCQSFLCRMLKSCSAQNEENLQECEVLSQIFDEADGDNDIENDKGVFGGDS